MTSTLKKNKDEIIYNLINSFLAGALVFVGAFSSGNISLTSVLIACAVASAVMIEKFKDYWKGEQKEYSKQLLNFI